MISMRKLIKPRNLEEYTIGFIPWNFSYYAKYLESESGGSIIITAYPGDDEDEEYLKRLGFRHSFD